jgi:hypothetical protein
VARYACEVSGIEGRRVSPAPLERASSMPSSARPRDPVLAALVLQRTVGNAGVARLVRDARLGGDGRRARNGLLAAPVRALQRFAGPEHEELGNTLHADIDLGHGVTLTWGQVLAVAGDEIGTIGELLADPETEAGRHRLGASLLNAEVKGPAAAALKPSDAEKKQHYDEFVLLALQNADHFPDSGRAMAAWGRHHGEALDRAVAAGLGGDRHAINVAYAYEAFGQHFLTDCYSGGHIRTPRAQIIDWYQAWAGRVTSRLIAGIKDRLIEDLVREASPQTSAPDAYLRYKIAPEVAPKIDNAIQNKAGGVTAFTRWLGLGIAGAISGTIHDADGAAGVEVASDDHPESWLAYGDGKLKSSPISFAQAAKAIAVAKAEVDRAYAIGAEEGNKAAGAGQRGAKARVAAEIGPPFTSVAKFIPRPMSERKPGTEWAYKPVPEWHWGKMGWKFADAVDAYIRAEVGGKLREKLAAADIDDVIERSGLTIHPRRAVDGLVRDFGQFPLETVGGLIGEPATLPSASPPGSKGPVIPPPEPGEPLEPSPEGMPPIY